MALRKFVYLDTTNVELVEQASGDEISLGKITLSGVGGIAIDAGNQLISNLADPVSPQDAATKAYADALAAGQDVKQSVRVATTANINLSSPGASIDGVTLSNGDRVLVKDQSTGSQNGIYVFNGAASAMTRSSDADISAEVTAGMFAFVSEGTVNGNTGWTLITDDPITLGTTALVFTQYAGPGTYTAGNGLQLVGTEFSVVANEGLVASGLGLAIELATNPGLQFDASGAAGKLEFKPDTTRGLNKDGSGAYIALAATPALEFASGLLQVQVSSTGGIERSISGLQAKLDGTTLQSQAAGLSVKGLPSLFEINGVAVGASVTAANLNTLTNGSNADTLHTHAAAASNGVTVSFTSNGAITKGYGVRISGANQVSHADSSVAGVIVYGVADATVSTGQPVEVRREGVCTGVLSGASAGVAYYCSSTGAPVVSGSIPGGSKYIQLGIAKNSTDMVVDIKDTARRAV